MLLGDRNRPSGLCLVPAGRPEDRRLAVPTLAIL
jgi:hypothetical protein